MRTHISDLITLGADCGYKIIAQSGHFAFSEADDPVNDFWGFREIVITKDGAVSSYIQVQSKADAKKIGKMIDVPAIRFGCAQDYEKFCASELPQREEIFFPPFCRERLRSIC